MSKVTSKLQVTIPKVVAARYGIAPGSDVEFVPAGASIRLMPERAAAAHVSDTAPDDPEERVRRFDELMRWLRLSTEERAEEEATWQRERAAVAAARGWTRDELYDRPRTWQP